MAHGRRTRPHGCSLARDAGALIVLVVLAALCAASDARGAAWGPGEPAPAASLRGRLPLPRLASATDDDGPGTAAADDVAGSGGSAAAGSANAASDQGKRAAAGGSSSSGSSSSSSTSTSSSGGSHITEGGDGGGDSDVRALWPEFLPRHEARTLKVWRNESKDTSPVLATADGSIRCWSDRDPRSFPRYQAFCFLERLCYMGQGKKKRQWFMPLPDPDEAGVDLTPLTMQREIPTGVRERVKGFAQSKSVVYMQGSGTHHFPEWIDGPMFLLGYQMHAWEFGLPRADVFFDNRHKDGVMTWINGVTSMVVAATGLREVHNQWKPPRSRTCYRGVVSFAARLEADAFFTRRAKKDRLEYKYEVSARRPFFYPADAIIWHETARQFAASTLESRSCCDNEDDYLALAQSQFDVMLARMTGQRSDTFNATVLQRGTGNGRRFHDVDGVKQCLHKTLGGVLGLPPGNVRVDVASWEGASLEQQITAASSSNLFMASHGAGGINFIWLEPCSVFVDAFPFNHFSPHFYGPPADNMGLVYSYTNFVPPSKHMASCLPRSVRKAGMSYTCMKMMDASCRSCVRQHSHLVMPCEGHLGLVVEYALLRRRQCLLELAYGMQPETLHGNM